MKRIARLAVALWLGLTPAGAAELVGPALGAASNFGQSWFPDILTGALALPVQTFRDELYWRNIDDGSGRWRFDNPRTSYPDALARGGAGLMLLVNDHHPDRDGGTTAATAPARAGFAAYTAALLHRFPAAAIVEVGNEMNSDTFASGPGWGDDIAQRAGNYAALLRATAAAARAARPDVTVIGGAAHSVPVAWMAEIFARGARQDMDALALHPYGMAPEQLVRTIAYLHAQVPDSADLPLAITEFGTTNSAAASAFLLKSYCQQALAGAAWSVWYPLGPRGDGFAPLVGAGGVPTDTGRVFRFVAARLSGLPVIDISPDPFTYGCRFGDRVAVLWGAPRQVAVTGLRRLDPISGAETPVETIRLNRDRPVVLVSDAATIRPGRNLTFGPLDVIADSFDQFTLTGADSPFDWLLRQGGKSLAMQVYPGQERSGVPWSPYLGHPVDGVARASAGWVQPSLPPAGPIAVVLRYTAPKPARATIALDIAPDGRSVDGVHVSLRLNGRQVHSAQVTAPTAIRLPDRALQAGDVVEAEIGPGRNGDYDASSLRMTIRHAD